MNCFLLMCTHYAHTGSSQGALEKPLIPSIEQQPQNFPEFKGKAGHACPLFIAQAIASQSHHIVVQCRRPRINSLDVRYITSSA